MQRADVKEGQGLVCLGPATRFSADFRAFTCILRRSKMVWLALEPPLFPLLPLCSGVVEMLALACLVASLQTACDDFIIHGHL